MLIKFDITILCEIFSGKDKKFIYSDTFFLICFNELKEKYYKEISIDMEKKLYKNQIKLNLNSIYISIEVFIFIIQK